MGPGIFKLVAKRKAAVAAFLDAIHGAVGFIEERFHVVTVCRVETDADAGAIVQS